MNCKKFFRYFAVSCIGLAAAGAVFFTACGNKKPSGGNNPSGGDNPPATSEEAAKAELPKIFDDNFQITKNNLTVVADTTSVPPTDPNGVTLVGSVYTITQAGVYTVKGSLAEGQIVVDAGPDDIVEIDLQAAEIACSTGAPILILNCDKTEISAKKNTVNTVIDKRTTAAVDDATTAAIYSQCDLKLKGNGTLCVRSDFEDGIHTKDDLDLKNLTLYVYAPENAIKGNDSVTCENAAITAVSENGDALKTSNSDISSKGKQRGTVAVSGGTLDLYARGDGIDAAYDVTMASASVTINTDAYSSYSTNPTAAGSANALAVSSKGVKAANSITLTSGNLTIRATDDALHSDEDLALENGEYGLGNINIQSGTATLRSWDDAVHAKQDFTARGGTIDVVHSHEGIEANRVYFNGANVAVNSDDDCVNAMRGAHTPLIEINAGHLDLSVGIGDTDTIDSNGDIAINGGTIILKNANRESRGTAGTIDCDGTVTYTGGTLIAIGAIARTVDGAKQNGEKSFSAGSYTLKNGAGTAIAEFTLSAGYKGYIVCVDGTGEYKLCLGSQTVLTENF